MLIRLNYLSNRVDNINDFSHQHLSKTQRNKKELIIDGSYC